MPNKKYRLNTNMNGEDRAFVMSGQYEDVLPMDLYPVHLLKAIMTNDIEKMEALGIYEVAPEDLALCEYACTSKTPVQKLIREGLDTAIQELG
jgi:Na+-transporting NADH:ubiquinone oxidoreductase subunit A